MREVGVREEWMAWEGELDGFRWMEPGLYDMADTFGQMETFSRVNMKMTNDMATVFTEQYQVIS